MSRTDKDAPWWVRAETYSPDHAANCPELQAGPYTRRQYPLRVCNLPERPVRQRPGFSGWRHWKDIGCTWDPDYEFIKNRNKWYPYWGPRRKDRHFRWWGPDRAKVRDDCRKAQKEYHGSKEVHVVPRTVNHRHGPDKGWWN